MSWINPKTWNVGELVTAAMMNKELRDRLNDLWKFVTKGDLLVATGPSDAVRLPVGANGQVLKANSARTQGMEWGTDPAMDLFAAHGDLLYGTGNDKATRLPVGAIGEVLRVQGGEGFRWPAWGIDPVTDMAVAAGDLFVATGPDTLVRLPRGSDGQVLMVDSGQAAGVKWATIPPNIVTGLWKNSSWNGQGKTTGTTTTMTASDFHPSIPNTAKAVQFHAAVKWPADDGENSLLIYQAGAFSNTVACRSHHYNKFLDSTGFVPLDSNGRFTIQLVGPHNATEVWIEATAYIP
jgi:hypothetical protein